MKFQKKVIKKFEGNDKVKYCEFVMSKFASLLRMETKFWPSDAVVLDTPGVDYRQYNYTPP